MTRIKTFKKQEEKVIIMSCFFPKISLLLELITDKTNIVYLRKSHASTMQSKTWIDIHLYLL